MITFIEGGKGGVGKSLMSGILVNKLSVLDDAIIIDTDTSNPDVYKAHHQTHLSFLQKIDTVTDWAGFLTLLDKHNKNTIMDAHGDEEIIENNIIVNMAARNQDSIQTWGDTLKEITEDIRVFFMMNTQKDSILLLKEYAKVINPKYIIPTKNYFFGGSEAFSLYDNSETKKLFKKEFFIEEVISTAADKFYTDRHPLSEVSEQLNIGDRIFYQRWLKNTKKRLDEVLLWN